MQTDVEAVVADLVKLVHSGGIESRRKAVRPKALLDNCLKVMRMLYGVPCEWGCGEPSGMGLPCVGVLSHELTSVPSAQVVGSPPNTAEDPSLDAFSSPRSLGCFLCSASPQQSPFGGHQGRCKGGTNATPSGTKCHPLWDPGTVHGHRVSSIRNARDVLQRCGLGGAQTQPPLRAGGCRLLLWGGDAALPCWQQGQVIAQFLLVSVFFLSFH